MGKYKLSKLVSLFRKFGGIRLLVAYSRLGVLGAAIKSWLKGVIMRTSADLVFYSYEPAIVSAVQAKYRIVMKESLQKYDRAADPRVRSNLVWFCWLQGIDNAPLIVKVCYQSIEDNLKGKEIRIIDESNRRNYVQLPDYIEERYKKGQIPHAMFSDLLRLELLIKYGGSWIDSTVFCSSPEYPKALLDADLFFFQYARPNNRAYAGISNWFITSCSNNPTLMTLRDMLYAYWAEFNCVVEYFIFHRFFDMIAYTRPEVVTEMPYAYSPNSHLLLRHWAETFDQTKWDKVTKRICFHKLAHQVDESVIKGQNNYYNHIIREYAE